MKPTITPPVLGDSTSNKKRINWLDVSRGIAFLMVIYSHLEYCNDSVMRYFSPVFLTTFFFVSGYLFKENCSFGKVLEQRTRTLLLPFLALGMIMILMNQVMSFHEHVTFLDRVKGLLFQNGENQILWFIAALYVYSVIFYWIEKLSKNAWVLLVVSVGLFFLNWGYKSLGMPSIPWHVDGFGFACFYMGIGKLYKEHETAINVWIDRKLLVVVALIWYVTLITVFDLHISFDGGKMMVDALAVTLPGLTIMIYVSKHILANSRFLLFVGANTLFYFAFHGKVFSLLQTVCHKLLSEDWLAIGSVQVGMGFAIAFLDAVVLILPAMFVNRYCPFLLGKGFKLWKA